MAVAKGQGVGGKSLPIGEGVLGGNRCRTCHLLYKTLLGAPTKGCVREEGEGHYLTCNHLPRQHGCACSHARRLGPVHMAAECGHASAATEVEQYGYCRGNAVDLSAVMPAMEFRVTDEEAAYLCAARGLIFEGSILAYNPTRDEVEWVPAGGVTNDLSWVEERMVVVLVNFVPHVPQEADHIVELGAHRLLDWADNSPSEEDDEQMQEEEDKPEGEEHKEAEEWEEEDPTNLEEQGETGLEADPQRRSWEWGSIMDDEQPLAFDDPQSDSDATVGGCSPVHLTLQVPGLSQDAVEVHVQDSEVEAL